MNSPATSVTASHAAQAATPWPRRAAHALLWLAAFLGAEGMIVPIFPNVIATADLDSSWRYVLNWAHVHGLVHGRDVVFTYGPWGFALSDLYYPENFAKLVAVQTFLTLCVVVACRAIAKRTGIPQSLAAIASVLVACLGRLTSAMDPLFYSLALMSAVLYVTRNHEPNAPRGGATLAPSSASPPTDDAAHSPPLPPLTARFPFDPALSLLACMLSLAGLIKFTFAIPALAAVGLITLADLRRRRLPMTALVFLLSGLAWWCLAGQPFSTLPAWLAASIDLAGGYDEAMTIASPTMWMYPVYAVVAAAILAPVLIAGRKKGDRPEALVLAGTLAVVLFAGYKSGFVRHDWGHELIATSGLAIASLVCLPVAWATRRATLRTAAIVSVLLGFAATDLSYRLSGTDARLLREIWARCVLAKDRYALSFQVTLRNPAALTAGFESAKAHMQQVDPLPQVTGTVDLYGARQGTLVTRGDAYAPRPVYQSYAAYTPALQARNADHLRSAAAAPDNVLLTVSSIDFRFPSLDDASSWPELLSRYEPADLTGDCAILRKSPTPHPWSLTPLGSHTVSLGQRLEVPSDEAGPVWVTVRFHRSITARPLTTLFKAPQPIIRVEGDDGPDEVYRLVPALADGGFLLSPVVKDAAGFVSLYLENGQPPAAPMRRVRVMRVNVWGTGYVKGWYRPQAEVAFYRLNYPRLRATANIREVRLRGVMTRLLQGEIKEPTDRPPVRLTQAPDGAPAVFAHPPTSLAADVPPGATALRFGFGLQPDVWQKAHPVRFELLALDGTVLWQQIVDPAKNPADRAPLAAEVRLPPGTSRVTLRTSLVDRPEWAWSYWSALEWK